MDEKRDEKGRFKRGYIGGPGRGKRKPSKPMTFEDIELLLQSDFKDSDPKVRHTATRLLIALKNKMPDPDDQPILDPCVRRLLHFQFNLVSCYKERTGRSLPFIEALDAMEEHIKTCPNSPIIPFDDNVAVKNDDL